MVYKYTAEQERVYRETGRRPRTSQLKRYTGKKTTQPTITTADGRVITEEQQRKEIIASVQKNYLDRNVSPPPELIKTLGLKVVTTTTKPTEPATQPVPKPVVKIAAPHPHLTQTEQLILAKNYQDFLQNKGAYANGQKYIISQGVHGPMKIRVDSDLTETRAVRTVIPQTYRILNKPISEVTKKYVKPSLTDYYYEGVKYGRKHPNIAKVASAGTKIQPAIVKQTLDPTSKNPNIVAKSIRAFSNGALAGVREDPLKVGLFLAIPAAFNTAAKGARLLPVTRAFVQSEKAMKLTAGAMGAVYTADVYARVTAPVVGSWSSSTKEERTKLKSGDVQVKTITTETPVYRKPTTDEMAYRLGGIFSTEVGPMAFGAIGLRRPDPGRIKRLNLKPKPVQKIKTKIIRASAAAKTTSSKIRSIVKTSRSKKITRLYQQIQAKNKQIELAKTKAEQDALLKDLNILESRITTEVAKKNKTNGSRLRSLLKDERAELALQRQRAPAIPKRKVTVAERTKSATEMKLETMLDYKTAKKLGIVPKTKAKTGVKVYPKTTKKTKVKTKVKVETKIKTKAVPKTATAVKTRTKTLVETKTRKKTKTAVKTRPVTKTKPSTRTKVKTRTAVQTKTAVKTRVKPRKVVTKFAKASKKSISKKRKRKMKPGMKEFSIKNPVPTLEDVI